MRLLLTSKLLLIHLVLFAQVKVGHFTDADGKPIVGYFDQMLYNPNTYLDHNMLANEFEKGYYYTNSGEKYEGFIKFKTDQFLFKEELEKRGFDRLKVEEVQSLVIGQDSFFVSTNFEIDNGIIPKKFDERNPQFLQYLGSFDHTDYAVYIVVNSSVIRKHYLVRPIGQADWERLPYEKERVDNYFTRYFLEIPPIKRDKSDNPLHGIKNAEYIYKMKENKPILYDQWWNEIDDVQNSKYHADIQLLDSIWILTYYEGQNKLYTANYNQLYPAKPHGITAAYYPNGIVRSKRIYDEGRLMHVQEYYSDGTLHYSYKTQWEEKRKIGLSDDLEFKLKDRKELGPIIFDEVRNEFGEDILDSSGNGLEVLNDEVNSRQIHRIFVNGIMSQSYFENGTNRIYQWLGGSINLNLVTYSWEHTWDYTTFLESKYLNIEGTKLFAIRINEKGRFVSSQSLNPIFSEFDEVSEQFFGEGSTGGASLSYKTDKLKVGGEKVVYEVVIPIQVRVTRLFREPKYNGYNNFWMMNHQHMMMQMPPQNLPTPPSFH